MAKLPSIYKGRERVAPQPKNYTVKCSVCQEPKVGTKTGLGWFCRYCQRFFCDKCMDPHYYEHALAELAGDENGKADV